jgi:hypothetical protein
MMPLTPVRRRRATLVAPLLLAASLAGCLAGFPSRPDVAPQPAFDPTVFFAGRTHGEGTLDVRVGRDRTLRVEGTGHSAADGSFVLDQTVTYDDGAVETRTWALRRVDATHYTATLSDAKGDVTAEATGNRFHLRYLLRQPAVYMEQWLILQPDGRTVRNDAQVTVLGVPWARLSEVITRER